MSNHRENDENSSGTPLASSSKSSKIVPHPIPGKVETVFGGNPKVPTHPKSVIVSSTTLEQIGRYQILAELGRGGMGAVFLAEDTILKRKVALKIPQFEPDKAEQMQARFLREAQIAAQLSHPNICRTYDVEVVDGQYVMAMEYLEGKTLAEFAKAGKLLKERQAVQLIKKIALAIEAAHQKGLIHRDLKPSNIMLPKPDPSRKSIEPKVMDFGLAKSFDTKATDLTKSGMIVGTPCYMSKEQWSGKEAQLGPQCDVYSLGVILYELLTGRLPYDVEDDEPATSWFVKLLTHPPIRPSERKSDIDAALEPIVMRAIAAEAKDRYPTMADFASDLNAWLKGKPTTGQTLMGIELGSFGSIVSPVNKGHGNRRHGSNPLWVLLSGFSGVTVLFFGLIFWFAYKPDGESKSKIDAGLKTTDHLRAVTEERSRQDTTDIKSAPSPMIGSLEQTTEDANASKIAEMPSVLEELSASLTAQQDRDNDDIPINSEWTGHLRLPEESIPEQSATATITKRTPTEFTVRISVEHWKDRESFVWDYHCRREEESYKVIKAELIKKTPSFIDDVGERPINDGTVTVNRDSLKLTLSRPTSTFVRVQEYLLSRSASTSDPNELDGSGENETSSDRDLSSDGGNITDPASSQSGSPTRSADETDKTPLARSGPKTTKPLKNSPKQQNRGRGLQNGDFSNGLVGWTAEGGATSFHVWNSPKYEGMTINTWGPKKDGDTGRLFQRFEVPANAQKLEFFVHGGRSPSLYIALQHNGRTVHTTTGHNSNDRRRVEWDISTLQGQSVVFEMVDNKSARGWGFIGFNGLRIIPQ